MCTTSSPVLFCKKCRGTKRPCYWLFEKDTPVLPSATALSIQLKFPQLLVRNQMERTISCISVRSDRNIWDHLWRCFTLTTPPISVGPTEKSLPFDKIVVPSTTLLYPACSRNNKQTRGGLERICETGMNRWNFRNFKPKFLLNGKRRGTGVSFLNSQYQGLLVPRDFLQKSTGEEEG